MTLVRTRRSEVELCRLSATFLIVWYHCLSSSSFIPYSGLVFFIIASSYFCIESKNTGTEQYRRAGMFMALWLCWYAIYLIFESALGHASEYSNQPMIVKLLVGPSAHLWYLPFQAGLMLVLHQLRILLRKELLMVGAAGIFLIAQLSVDEWRAPSIQQGMPIAQYLHALPGVFVGLAFAGAAGRTLRIKQLVYGFALLSTIPAWHYPGVGVTYFLGILLSAPLLFDFNVVVPYMRYAAISKYMLGIYLLHPIFIRLFRRLLDIDGFMLAVVVFPVALTFVWIVLQRGGKLAKLFSV